MHDKVSFTTISVILYTIAHAATWDYLSSLVIPTIWGVATSFTTAFLLDSTVISSVPRRERVRMDTRASNETVRDDATK